ncbi:MAG: hypothetical protein K6F34_05060, partial [Lachnospiraceae bacterium]|nr:hypothetical protein [Lachnospiraceae bacterium]
MNNSGRTVMKYFLMLLSCMVLTVIFSLSEATSYEVKADIKIDITKQQVDGALLGSDFTYIYKPATSTQIATQKDLYESSARGIFYKWEVDTYNSSQGLDISKVSIDSVYNHETNVSISYNVYDDFGDDLVKLYLYAWYKCFTSPLSAIPAADSITANSVTLKTVTPPEGRSVEYRCGDGDWQDSPEFTGLSPSTAYTFYQRIKETDLLAASEATSAAIQTYASQEHTITVTNDGHGTGEADPSCTSCDGLVSLSATPESGYVFYNWTTDDSDIHFESATSANTTFSMVDRDVTVKANFASIPHVHSFVGTVTTEPTLFKEGVMTYRCSCGASYTEPIPKLEPSDPEEAEDIEQLLADLTGDDGELRADIDVKTEPKDDGSTVTTITIGDQEVEKIITDEDGDEMIETNIWTLGGDEEFTYTALPITPEVHVYDGIHRLSEGSDYKVKYADNKNAGTAAVTVSFAGNYAGTAAKTVNFTINPADLAEADVEDTVLAASVKALKPAPAVTLEGGGTVNSEVKFTYLDSEGKKIAGIREAGAYTVQAEPKKG